MSSKKTIINIVMDQLEPYLRGKLIANASEYTLLWKKKLTKSHPANFADIPNRHFEQQLHFPGLTLILNFDEEFFVRNAARFRPYDVRLSDICETEKSIKKYNYSHIDSMPDDYSFNTQPIIAAPCGLFGQFTYLIVDGNHRVTFAKEHQISEISVCHVPSAIAVNGLVGNFECALYALNLELHSDMRNYYGRAFPLEQSIIRYI